MHLIGIQLQYRQIRRVLRKGLKMTKATIRQQVYITDLYNQLDVPFSKRTIPETAEQAGTLIDFLKDEVEQKRNRESGGYSL